MRILFVGKRYYTNKDALSERFGRIYRLPLMWSRAGCDVRLELIDYHSMSPVSGHAPEVPATSRGAINPLAWYRLHARAAAFRPDVVIASGDCYIGLAAHRIARRRNAHFVFDIYDDYRAFGGYRLFAGWDAYGYLGRRADQCWYTSQRLMRESASADRVCIPNGVDAALFRSLDRTICRRELGLPEEARIVGYFGSMEAQRGIDDLLAAGRALAANDPGFRLLLAGGSPSRERIALPFVLDLGNVPHERVPTLIGATDVVALPYRRGALIDGASSLKMAEYLFCRRPIVATRTPSLLDNFPQQAAELADVLAEPSDPASLASSLRAQLSERQLATVPEDAAWPAIAERALDALRTLHGRGRQRAS